MDRPATLEDTCCTELVLTTGRHAMSLVARYFLTKNLKSKLISMTCRFYAGQRLLSTKQKVLTATFLRHKTCLKNDY